METIADKAEDIHMSCLGVLCKPFSKYPSFLSKNDLSKEESRFKVTLRPNKVTCQKCIEILKKQGILK